jgi:hypothetical protein
MTNKSQIQKFKSKIEPQHKMNQIDSIVIILKLMERSDSTICHSSFDIVHSKGGFLGAWNLDIVCYLLFGAWRFGSSKKPLLLDILFGFYNLFVGHNNRWGDYAN